MGDAATSCAGSSKTAYNGIDLAKFLFAFMVCAIHISPFAPEFLGIGTRLNYGLQNILCRLAVPFYFGTTGFLLFRKTGLQVPAEGVVKNHCFKILRLLGTWSILLVLGGTDHLWYLSATVVAVALTGLCLRRRIPFVRLAAVALVLYAIGLLGDSYYGLAYYPLNRFSWFQWLDKSYRAVFLTTRNGLFMGFPFVLLGAWVAGKVPSRSGVGPWLGFACSLVLLLVEALVLRHFRLSRDHNLYLSLLPATYFLLRAVSALDLADRPVYPKLRAMGVLIYMIHMLSCEIVTPLMAPLKEHLGSFTTLLRFLLVALVSLGISALVVWLGGKEKCKWLRWLYS